MSLSYSLNPRIKILHIVEAMGGGVFTFLVDLANNLCDEFDIVIAHGLRSETPDDYGQYFDEKIQLIEVKNFNRSINILQDLKAFCEIRQIANDVKPDIIHLHSSKAGAIGRWAFWEKHTPLYYSPHGYSFLMQDATVNSRHFYKFIEKISGRRPCTTIACSQGEYEASLDLNKKVALINNGINVDELQSLINIYGVKEDPNKLIVYTSGRICSPKNPELFNAVAEKVPDVSFLWIGDGELRGKLKSPNIHITGWLDRKSALKYSMTADIFILPSLWEGMPLSLLEAMYLKKLCLVSDAIGNRDVIENGVNGFICNNAEEYVEIVQKRSSSNLKLLTERAHQDIIIKHNSSKMTADYKKVYLTKI